MGLGNTLGPPRGVPRGPERASEESNDTRHVGYQFSQFSTLKTNTGSTHHQNFESDSHLMTHGRPWVQGCPWEVSEEPNDTMIIVLVTTKEK